MKNLKQHFSSAVTDFDQNAALQLVLAQFPKVVLIQNGFCSIYGEPSEPYEIYSQIEDVLFDLRSEAVNQERKDFFEVLEFMAWAIYRVWNKLLERANDSDPQEVCISLIDQNKVLELFWENLSCEEGAALRQRMGRS